MGKFKVALMVVVFMAATSFAKPIIELKNGGLHLRRRMLITNAEEREEKVENTYTVKPNTLSATTDGYIGLDMFSVSDFLIHMELGAKVHPYDVEAQRQHGALFEQGDITLQVPAWYAWAKILGIATLKFGKIPLNYLTGFLYVNPNDINVRGERGNGGNWGDAMHGLELAIMFGNDIDLNLALGVNPVEDSLYASTTMLKSWYAYDYKFIAAFNWQIIKQFKLMVLYDMLYHPAYIGSKKSLAPGAAPVDVDLDTFMHTISLAGDANLLNDDLTIDFEAAIRFGHKYIAKDKDNKYTDEQETLAFGAYLAANYAGLAKSWDLNIFGRAWYLSGDKKDTGDYENRSFSPSGNWIFGMSLLASRASFRPALAAGGYSTDDVKLLDHNVFAFCVGANAMFTDYLKGELAVVAGFEANDMENGTETTDESFKAWGIEGGLNLYAHKTDTASLCAYVKGGALIVNEDYLYKAYATTFKNVAGKKADNNYLVEVGLKAAFN